MDILDTRGRKCDQGGFFFYYALPETNNSAAATAIHLGPYFFDEQQVF